MNRGPMAGGWLVRALQPADLPQYRTLRLEALRAHPDAFGKSYEEELAEPAPSVPDPPGITLGGFVEGRLVGSMGVFVSLRLKQRHKGHVAAVYVAPAWRRTGLSRDLLAGLIRHARDAGLVSLTLSVTAGNEPARRLYLDAGFRCYGVEPASLCVGGRLLDEDLMVLMLSARTAPVSQGASAS